MQICFERNGGPCSPITPAAVAGRLGSSAFEARGIPLQVPPPAAPNAAGVPPPPVGTAVAPPPPPIPTLGFQLLDRDGRLSGALSFCTPPTGPFAGLGVLCTDIGPIVARPMPDRLGVAGTELWIMRPGAMIPDEQVPVRWNGANWVLDMPDAPTAQTAVMGVTPVGIDVEASGCTKVLTPLGLGVPVEGCVAVSSMAPTSSPTGHYQFDAGWAAVANGQRYRTIVLFPVRGPTNRTEWAPVARSATGFPAELKALSGGPAILARLSLKPPTAGTAMDTGQGVPSMPALPALVIRHPHDLQSQVIVATALGNIAVTDAGWKLQFAFDGRRIETLGVQPRFLPTGVAWVLDLRIPSTIVPMMADAFGQELLDARLRRKIEAEFDGVLKAVDGILSIERPNGQDSLLFFTRDRDSVSRTISARGRFGEVRKITVGLSDHAVVGIDVSPVATSEGTEFALVPR